MNPEEMKQTVEALSAQVDALNEQLEETVRPAAPPCGSGLTSRSSAGISGLSSGRPRRRRMSSGRRRSMAVWMSWRKSSPGRMEASRTWSTRWKTWGTSWRD